MEPAKRFYIRTYGCQMNVHDSEKMANVLHHAGFATADCESEADLLVINTCSIRDKAEQQLYSDLGLLRAWKRDRPGRIVGVGGCVAQQVGDTILKRFPHVDFVFGTHNLDRVAALVTAAEDGERSVVTQERASLDRFDLPALHPAYEGSGRRRAYLTVMEGCDMFCSFCIVPQTRGREISRRADDILDEARELADRGIREITLLGQTVNAYGRHDVRRSSAERAGTMAFSKLLRQLDTIPGLERIRYTSPHPIFFDEDLIRAHGELKKLCPHVHLPVQSGSDRTLARMRRRYTREDYLRIVADLREARSDIAITSDVIVGFPGETEADFERTLSLIPEAGFVDHFSFKYSPRPGTPAARLSPETVIPAQEAQQRLEALQQLQRSQTLAYHRSRVGTPTEILLDGPSRRGGGQLCGRDPYLRVVNLHPPGRPDWAPKPGDLLPVEIVEATPHSLIGTAKSPSA